MPEFSPHTSTFSKAFDIFETCNKVFWVCTVVIKGIWTINKWVLLNDLIISSHDFWHIPEIYLLHCISTIVSMLDQKRLAGTNEPCHLSKCFLAFLWLISHVFLLTQCYKIQPCLVALLKRPIVDNWTNIP